MAYSSRLTQTERTAGEPQLGAAALICNTHELGGAPQAIAGLNSFAISRSPVVLPARSLLTGALLTGALLGDPRFGPPTLKVRDGRARDDEVSSNPASGRDGHWACRHWACRHWACRHWAWRHKERDLLRREQVKPGEGASPDARRRPGSTRRPITAVCPAAWERGSGGQF